MLNHKKSVSVICAAALVATGFSTAVSAKNEPVGGSGVRLWGNTECKKSGELICIDVWAHNSGAEDLRKAASKDEYTDFIVFRDDMSSGEDGAYNITISFGDRKSGIYDAYIGCSCGEDIKKETIVFSNANENKEAIALLNKAVADGAASGKSDAEIAKEVENICTDKKYALGLGDDYPIDSYAAGLIAAQVKGKALDENDKLGVIALCEKAAVISAIKSGKLSDLFDESAMLHLGESRIKDLYTADFVDKTFGLYMTGKLKPLIFKTIDEFYDGLYEQFVLTTVKMPNGYKNIQTVVDEFSVEVFGKSRTLTMNEAIKIQNKDFASYAALAEAIGDGSQGGNSGGTGGSSGGSKGSSSGGIRNGEFSDDYATPDTPDKISKNIFDDIDDVSWAVESIVELAQKGIINGKGDRLFYPNDNITREEFVKIIVKTFFENAAVSDKSFDDVSDGEWYAEFVKKACGEGIINGISENLFGTGANITREDMAVIAYRTALKSGKMKESERVSGFIFADDEQISDYAKTAVYALYDAGIINGVSEDEFAAKDYLTRAQAAKIIYGIYSLK